MQINNRLWWTPHTLTIPEACLGLTLKVAFSLACLKRSSAAFSLEEEAEDGRFKA
jgi:hypothetical protein